MNTMPIPQMQKLTNPTLLFNDECKICRRIARWVQASAQIQSGDARIVERPIGDDPEALRSLNPDLDIWKPYETIHLLMPDGSMKLGGEAVAEVLRNLRSTQWFAWSFAVGIFGFRPFQLLLNLSYALLAGMRPLLGCESCGTPSVWMRPIGWMIQEAKVLFGHNRRPSPTPHLTSLAAPAR
jgi:predicted DCC family thiol-disulfide oxidoreductase YuxK